MKTLPYQSIVVFAILFLFSIKMNGQGLVEKVNGTSLFSVTDTASAYLGEMPSSFINPDEDQAILIDGSDIQAISLIDSSFEGSFFYLMGLGGKLHLGNSMEDIEVEGTMNVDSIKFEDRGYQRHPSGEIAFGNINKGLKSLSAVSGTDNFSINWNTMTKEYDITFDDYTYNRDDFTTLVTPRGTNVHHWRANGAPGELNITFFDSAGNKIESSFQFVTYYFVPSVPDGIILLSKTEKEVDAKRR